MRLFALKVDFAEKIEVWLNLITFYKAMRKYCNNSKLKLIFIHFPSLPGNY